MVEAAARLLTGCRFKFIFTFDCNAYVEIKRQMDHEQQTDPLYDCKILFLRRFCLMVTPH